MYKPTLIGYWFNLSEFDVLTPVTGGWGFIPLKDLLSSSDETSVSFPSSTMEEAIEQAKIADYVIKQIR